jgi:hypothetical protein
MANARVMVDSVQAAAETLVAVLEHARKTKHDYEFGPINAESVMRVGLYLDGDIEEILDHILEVPGAIVSP